MTKLRAVIFDWDGTLVDSADLILRAFDEATTDVLGENFPVTRRDERLVLSMPVIDSFGMLSDDPLVVEALLDRYHAAYTRLGATLLRPRIEAHAVLRGLRARGLRIGVVTSKARKRVDSDARRCELDGLVDALVTPDTAAIPKPHPAPVRECLTLLRVAGEEALFAGDGPHDIIAARAAGLVTIAVVTGTYSREDLAQESPDFVVESLAGVVGVVDRLAAPQPRQPGRPSAGRRRDPGRKAGA